MAFVANNNLTDGLRGMFGKEFIFRTLRKKTVVSPYTIPSKSKETEAQKATRSKFRDAAFWAKITLQDPEQKAYYLKKAKKLGLPNAYTAAITDYMRKPRLLKSDIRGGKVSFSISKKDFVLKKVEVISPTNQEMKLVNHHTWWDLCMRAEDLPLRIQITDAAERITLLDLT